MTPIEKEQREIVQCVCDMFKAAGIDHYIVSISSDGQHIIGGHVNKGFIFEQTKILMDECLENLGIEDIA